MPRDEFDIIDERQNKRSRKKIEGTIVALNYTIARLRPKGSTRLIDCDVQASNVAVGKLAVAEWIPGRKRRVITSVSDPGNALIPSTPSVPVTVPAPPEEDGTGVFTGFVVQSHTLDESRTIPADHFTLIPNFFVVPDGLTLTVEGELFVFTL